MFFLCKIIFIYSKSLFGGTLIVCYRLIMARSLNKVILLGNLGRDPELKDISQGKSICTIKIATSETFKDRNGQWQETTDWHTIIAWDKLAEIAASQLRKGSRVMIEGRLKTRGFERDGRMVQITEIIAQNLIILTEHEKEFTHKVESDFQYKDEVLNFDTSFFQE